MSRPLIITHSNNFSNKSGHVFISDDLRTDAWNSPNDVVLKTLLLKTIRQEVADN